MAPHLSSVYVSGWQCSSTASTTNEPGPDFADYPMNTVPNKVDQLVRAQMHHDRRQHQERSAKLLQDEDPGQKVDYLTPIIGTLCSFSQMVDAIFSVSIACRVADMIIGAV